MQEEWELKQAQQDHQPVLRLAFQPSRTNDDHEQPSSMARGTQRTETRMESVLISDTESERDKLAELQSHYSSDYDTLLMHSTGESHEDDEDAPQSLLQRENGDGDARVTNDSHQVRQPVWQRHRRDSSNNQNRTADTPPQLPPGAYMMEGSRLVGHSSVGMITPSPRSGACTYQGDQIWMEMLRHDEEGEYEDEYRMGRNGYFGPPSVSDEGSSLQLLEETNWAGLFSNSFFSAQKAVILCGGVLFLLVAAAVGVVLGLRPAEGSGNSQTYITDWRKAFELCQVEGYLDLSRTKEGVLPVFHELRATLEITNVQEDSCSPQNLAVLSVVFDRAESLHDTEQIYEQYVLYVLFFSTGGPNWRIGNDWPSNDGSVCSMVGVDCDDNDSVTGLTLKGFGLNGSLPLEFFRLNTTKTGTIVGLSNLEALQIYEQDLTGTIPSLIGLLSTLTSLIVWMERTTSTLPTELGTLTRLEELNMENPLFVGHVPSELSNLSNLTELVLTGDFTGKFNEDIFLIPELASLTLRTSSAEGNLSTIFENKTNWEIFSIERGKFFGTVSPSIGKLSSLRLLRIATSQISGPIPTEIGHCTELDHLEFRTNPMFTGTIPSEIGNLSKLMNLLLYDCNYTGLIPDALWDLPDLSRLTLSGTQGENALYGSVPDKICDKGNLELNVPLYSDLCEACGAPHLYCCQCI